VITKKQITWLGVAGSIASIVGLYLAFYPIQAKSPEPAVQPPVPPSHRLAQTQSGNTNSTQIGIVSGDVTIHTSPATSPTSAFRSPADRARAELLQLGVQWNSESFIRAIVDGDIRSVDLFLKGGMKPDLNYKGASAAVYALQAGANNRETMLKFLLSNGLNPNARLIDARIMAGMSEMLPPLFEHSLTPLGYESWKRQFAGPADLWLVIRSSYAGPEPGDFEQLRALASGGARFDVSLAFLREYESTFGGTPVYWEVRNEVERLAKVPLTRRKS